MTSYAELEAYWLALPAQVPALKLVTVGRDEQALDNQTAPGLVLYPHLRVDTPSITYLNDDEGEATRYTFQIFLLAPENTNMPRTENAVLSSMEQVLRSVYRRLWIDADAGLFDLVKGPAEGDAIRAWSGDNCFGWTMKIQIVLYVGEC
jgi:hypothetical protein